MTKTRATALKDELGQEDGTVLKHHQGSFDRQIVTGIGDDQIVGVIWAVERLSAQADVRSYQDVTDDAVAFLSSKDLHISYPRCRHSGNPPAP